MRPTAALALTSLTALLTLAAPPSAHAQEGAAQQGSPAAAAQAAIRRLDFLVGEWEGPAWAMIGRGTRINLRQTESVKYAAGNTVLLVEGLGRDSSGTMRFNAAAVVSWTPERGYVIRSWTHEGRSGEYPMTLTDRGFVWTIPLPNGASVRHTMTLTPEGEWLERSEYTPDGTRYIPTVELRVAKRR